MVRKLSESVSHAFGSLRTRMERFEKKDADPHRQHRIRGIRSRLGLAMAAALLPFLLLGLAQVRGEYQRQSEDLKTDLQLAAIRSATHASDVLTRTDNILFALAPEDTGPYCSTRLSILSQRMPDVDAIYRVDSTGRPLCASDDNLSATLGDIGQQDWFTNLKQSDTASMLYLVHPADSPFVVQIERVIRRSGSGTETFAGAMIAIVPLSVLQLDPAAQGLGTGAQTALFDTKGQPMTRVGGTAFDAPRSTLSRWLGNEGLRSGILRAEDSSGEKRFYASAPLRGVGIVAVMSAPTASPWFWAKSNPIRFLMMPLAACLTAFAAVMFASERIIIRWLDYLDRIAAIYARGRYSVRPVQADNAPLEIRHLAQTMDELGESITKRDAALTEALEEKDALLREIHHRVKNNLQIISSLLSMQQRAVADPAARSALGDTRQRISALALIYRTLYQGTDVRHADAKTFLNELVGHLISSESLRGPVISSEVDADDLRIDPEKLAPMALWLVEAISNARKHAFADRGGVLKVRFRVQGETSHLEVEDDGPGLGDSNPGVGLTLMAAFGKQLRGSSEIVHAPDGGSIARLTLVTPQAHEDDAAEQG